MAKARILAPWVGKVHKPALYHCVSRVVDRQFHFGRAEKDQFVSLMRIYEEFCGVRVLSYCIMSNHFHLLVEVPPKPSDEISDAEILRRVSMVQSRHNVKTLRDQFNTYWSAEKSGEITSKGRRAHEQLRAKYLARMCDLGQFMKTLKQRFSRWFNNHHERKGTLWEERYSSSLVEGGYAAMVTAAYIDLNPIRAGIVADPKDYRWCSYAEALTGSKIARSGIAAILHKKDGGSPEKPPSQSTNLINNENTKGCGWPSIARRYRLFLYGEGRAPGDSQQAREIQGAKRSKRKGFTNEQIKRETDKDAQIDMVSGLQSRIRSFTDGGVLGSKQFIDNVITELNEQRYWSKPRKSGASPVKANTNTHRDKNTSKDTKETRKSSTGIWSLRRLQKE